MSGRLSTQCITMEVETAARFISMLTKSLQSVIHGCLDFEKDIELGGYIYLRVDSSEKLDYVLSEKMQKNDVNSLTFLSNSFRAVPQGVSDQTKPCKESTIPHLKDQTESQSQNTGDGTKRHAEDSRPGSSHRYSPSHALFHRGHLDASISAGPSGFSQGVLDAGNFDSTGNRKSRHTSGSSSDQSGHNFLGVQRSSTDKTPCLTDFQTAFHASQPSHAAPGQLQQTSAHSTPFSGTERGHTAQSLQHKGKERLLPDAGDMEVVYVKTEEEDEVFSIPLNPPSDDVADDLTVRRKPSWLSLGVRQPFGFPYPRLARSQSWDRRFTQAVSGPRSPMYIEESSAGAESYSCKVCGKSYRSRQGLIFHERVKHQNIYNVYCPVCGKGFQQSSHMYGHMATHTNVKNFQCQACGAKYAHKTSLQQHIRSGSCRSYPRSSNERGEEFHPASHSQTVNRSPTMAGVTLDQRPSQQQGPSVDMSSGSGQEEIPVSRSGSQDSGEALNQPVNFSKGDADTESATNITSSGEENHSASAEERVISPEQYQQ